MNDLSQMTGLDHLNALIEGKVPPPPMAGTVNITLTEAEHGRSVFKGRPDGNVLNPAGAVHGGWYGAILDSAMGCAVHSTLEPTEGYTTLEYKVNITRAVDPGTEVTVRGHVQHRGRRTAVATAEMHDPEGRLCATGSTTCIILRP